MRPQAVGEIEPMTPVSTRREQIRRPALRAVATIVLATQLCGLATQAHARGKPGGGGDAGVNLENYTFAFEDAKSGDIYVTTIDDGDRVKVASSKGGELGGAAWSPDLSADSGYQGVIAYLDFQSDRRDLYVTDGNQSQLVRSFSAADSYPGELDSDVTLSWTPNGREIVFASKSTLIGAVELATGNLRILLDFTGDLGPDTQDVTVSPFMIGYIRGADVWIADYDFDAAGLIEVDLESITNVTNTPDVAERACSFSRDGTYISCSRLAVRWEIVVFDLLTMQETVVLDDLGGPREAAWSPDGSQLGIHDVGASSTSGQRVIDLFRITDWDDPLTRTVIRVTTTDKSADERYPDWNPGPLQN